MSESPTWILFSRFTGISLLAVGGANAVVPEMHRQLVQLHPLLSERDFGALVGLAQAAPGPNVMVVGLLGFRVAGILGACCATAGMSLPPAVLSVALSRLWRGGAGAGRWQQPLADALLPLTVGLVLASSYTLLRGSGLGVSGLLLAVAVGGLTALGKVPPLLLLAGAALLAAAFGR
jgi:chromate transporter